MVSPGPFAYSSTAALKFDTLLYHPQYKRGLTLHAVIRFPSKRTEDGIGRIE